MVSANERKTPEGSNQNALTSKLEALGPGEHLCCLFETEEEHRAVLTPFLRYGLERGEKVLYIVDAHTAGAVLGYLRDAGVAVEPFLASGQMSILTPDDAYMRGGVFDPDAMIGILRDETDRAVAQGYRALRVTGEMSWALRGLPGAEKLIEYESKLNEFFPGSKCLAICQYDRRRFGAEVLLDVLTTHPLAIVGGMVYDNFYYVPPQEFLGPDRPAAALRQWLQNLTDRSRSQEALERSEREKAAILDSISEVLLYQDREGNILWANRSAAESAGLTPEDLVGRRCYEAWHGRAERCADCPVARAIETGLPQEGEMATPDERFWRVRADLVRDEERNIVGVVEAALDITERKRAEEELRRQEEALQRAARLESIGKLAGGVAHDFNNLMTGILGYSDFLLHDLEEDDPRRQDVEEVKMAARRAADLTRQLLAFSRRETLEPEVLDLDAVVTNMSRMLERLVGEHIKLVTALEPALGRVKADKTHMEQVIMNLLGYPYLTYGAGRLRQGFGGLPAEGSGLWCRAGG